MSAAKVAAYEVKECAGVVEDAFGSVASPFEVEVGQFMRWYVFSANDLYLFY